MAWPSEMRFMTWKDFADLWRHAGVQYRIGFFLMALGALAFLPSGIALGMLMSNQAPGTFGWASLICAAVGLALITLGNWMRFQAIGTYRERRT
jgi:hypothetical protein